MFHIVKHLAFIYNTILIIEQYGWMVDVKIDLLILINSSLSLSLSSWLGWVDFGGCVYDGWWWLGWFWVGVKMVSEGWLILLVGGIWLVLIGGVGL